MDQPTNPSVPGEQPAPAPVTESAPASGAQPTPPSNPSVLINEMSEGDLLAAINLLEQGSPAAPAAPTPEEAPAAEAPGDQPEPEAEKPPEEAPVAESESKPNPATKRTRLSESEFDLVAQARELVRQGTSKDFQSAMASLVAAPPADPFAPPASQPEAKAPEPAPAPQPDPVAALETKLSELRQERKTAKAEFDTDKEDTLTSQIEDLLAEKAELKAQARVTEQLAKRDATANAKTYDQQFDAACDELESIYPEAKDENSAFTEILNDKIDAARARGDQAIDDPRYILAFAEQVASRLGISKKTATKAAPAPLPQAPAAQHARPTGQTVAPGNIPPARQSPSDVKLIAQELSLEELASAIFTQ